MVSKVLITGATGYVGGSILQSITSAHPELEVTVVLRKVPEAFPDKYPSVKTVIGTFDTTSVLESAASDADIVIHAGDSDHAAAVQALLAGLSGRSTPSFYIHLSGTAFTYEVDGRKGGRAWSDIDNLDEIRALPETLFHRKVDELVLTASKRLNAQHLRTALVVPPGIYGRGTGPSKTQSFLAPFYLNDVSTLFKAPFYFKEGENVTSYVHIKDLMNVYLKLVEEAAKGGGKADWNEDGFYFAPVHEPVAFKDFAAAVGESLKKEGLVESETPISVAMDQLAKTVGSSGLGPYLYTASGISRGDRVKRLFGLTAQEPGLLATVEEDISDAVREVQRQL